MNALAPKFGQADFPEEAEQKILDARDLITDGIKTYIQLDGKIYTLRITRAGKLILTK